jgi:hypothetical protein
MAYEVNTLAEYLEMSGEDRSMSRDDIAPRVLDCKVWIAMVSLPGCLPHSWSAHRSRRAAAATLRDYHGGGKGARELGRMLNTTGEGCAYVGSYAYEICRTAVREHF